MRRLGVDVGGTFTDLILVDEESGRITVDKVPSTPDDPARGSADGIPIADGNWDALVKRYGSYQPNYLRY